MDKTREEKINELVADLREWSINDPERFFDHIEALERHDLQTNKSNENIDDIYKDMLNVNAKGTNV